MKDTEVIRILNDLNREATGNLKERICGHIDNILEKIECAEPPEPDQLPSETPEDGREQAEQSKEPESVMMETQPEPDPPSEEKPLLREKEVAKTKPGGAKPKFDVGKLRALRRGNWTVKKIAEEMGCSEATIYNYMKKEGIK